MSTYKLVLKYGDSAGATITHTWPYAMSNVTASTVNSFMQTCITNGALFSKVPVTKKSAVLVETDETELTIS